MGKGFEYITFGFSRRRRCRAASAEPSVSAFSGTAMAGRPPKVGHVRSAFLRESQSARDLMLAVQQVAAINPNAAGPRLHPEQARRVVELAFLGLISSWEEFLEQSFVRYLAGAKADDGSSPPLRLGQSSGIPHSYQLISGDPSFDPSKNYSKFGEPKWVIAISKNYFEHGAPYAALLHANVEILQHAVKLRNRVAHTSTKCREDFKRSARAHLGLADNAGLTQGYSVGDLLLSPANRLFGQEARDKNWTYFYAYAVKLRQMARRICPK